MTQEIRSRSPHLSNTFQFNDFSSLIQSMQILQSLFPDQNNKKNNDEVWEDYDFLQNFVEDNQQQQKKVDFNQNSCLLTKYKYFMRKIYKDEAKLKSLKEFYDERQNIIDNNQTLLKIDQNISFFKEVNAQLKKKEAQLVKKISIQKEKLQANDLARKQYKKMLKQIKKSFFQQMKEYAIIEQQIANQNNRQILEQIWNKMNYIALQAYSLRCSMKSTQKINQTTKIKPIKQINNPPIQKIDGIINQAKQILTKQTINNKYSADLRRIKSNRQLNNKIMENIWKESQISSSLLKNNEKIQLNLKRTYLNTEQSKKCGQILGAVIDATKSPVNSGNNFGPMSCRSRRCYNNPSKSTKRRKSKLFEMLYTQRGKRYSPNTENEDPLEQNSFILNPNIEQKLNILLQKQLQFRKISNQQMLKLVIEQNCHKQLLQLLKNQKVRYLDKFFGRKLFKQNLTQNLE